MFEFIPYIVSAAFPFAAPVLLVAIVKIATKDIGNRAMLVCAFCSAIAFLTDILLRSILGGETQFKSATNFTPLDGQHGLGDGLIGIAVAVSYLISIILGAIISSKSKG